MAAQGIEGLNAGGLVQGGAQLFAQGHARQQGGRRLGQAFPQLLQFQQVALDLALTRGKLLELIIAII